jgi:hypothetical protein
MRNGKDKELERDPIARYWLKLTKHARMEAGHKNRTALSKAVRMKKGNFRYLI